MRCLVYDYYNICITKTSIQCAISEFGVISGLGKNRGKRIIIELTNAKFCGVILRCYLGQVIMRHYEDFSHYDDFIVHLEKLYFLKHRSLFNVAGFLYIQDTEETDRVIHAEEFSTVNLWCNVTGSPVPVVKWFMETQDGQQYGNY